MSGSREINNGETPVTEPNPSTRIDVDAFIIWSPVSLHTIHARNDFALDPSAVKIQDTGNAAHYWFQPFDKVARLNNAMISDLRVSHFRKGRVTAESKKET